MKNNNDSFFTEPVDAQQAGRFVALEVISRLMIWITEADSLEERGVRTTVVLFCVRPDLIKEQTLDEIGEVSGRSRQAVHQLADSFRATTGLQS